MVGTFLIIQNSLPQLKDDTIQPVVGIKAYIDLPYELETCANSNMIDTNDTNYKVAKTLDLSGDMNGAISYLNRAIDSNQCNVNAYILRASQHRKKKDYLNAKHDLFITIKLMPTYSDGYYQLGLIYDELGQKEVATYLFKKSCSLNNKEACNLVK
jgi:tetratricopeptide (TPR) repeat protein